MDKAPGPIMQGGPGPFMTDQDYNVKAPETCKVAQNHLWWTSIVQTINLDYNVNAPPQ